MDWMEILIINSSKIELRLKREKVQSRIFRWGPNGGLEEWSLIKNKWKINVDGNEYQGLYGN